MAAGDYYFWSWRTVPVRRWEDYGDSPCYGHRVKLIRAGGMKGMALVEFDCGTKVLTDRRGLRKIPKTS